MKKIILFIAFIIIYGSNYSQTYYPLVDTNRIWSTLYQTDDTSSPYFVQKTEFIKFSIDTLIRGKFYKKNFKSNDSLMINWKENGFIREDSLKKVYYLSNENSNEILIYDFNITINDTIKLPQFDAQLVVDSINYIEIGEHQRKQIYLSSSNGSEVWIEGIGSLFGILNSGLGIPCGGSYHLLCFTENNNLLYQNNEFNTCYLFTDITEEIINTKIKVFPNPVEDFLIIEIDLHYGKYYYLNFYNVFGTTIKSIVIHKGYNRLYINNLKLQTGIYFYNIYDVDKTLYSGKIMIK